jgi:hypothetical protein
LCHKVATGLHGQTKPRQQVRATGNGHRATRPALAHLGLSIARVLIQPAEQRPHPLQLLGLLALPHEAQGPQSPPPLLLEQQLLANPRPAHAQLWASQLAQLGWAAALLNRLHGIPFQPVSR